MELALLQMSVLATLTGQALTANFLSALELTRPMLLMFAVAMVLVICPTIALVKPICGQEAIAALQSVLALQPHRLLVAAIMELVFLPTLVNVTPTMWEATVPFLNALASQPMYRQFVPVMVLAQLPMLVHAVMDMLAVNVMLLFVMVC
jgi:hypothetical protein